MMSLDDVQLLDLMPEYLRSDPVTIALCNAFDPLFTGLSEKYRAILVYTHVENLPGRLLDEIAWGFDIGWYDPTATLAARRQVVKQALSVFRRIGTASAIRDAVSAGFGDATVEEWWEYNGDPGCFRILVEDESATTTKAIEFLRQVSILKNVRSHLDGITLISQSPAPMYFGAASIITSREESEQIG
ncbi:MAG: phage tail protein I [Candidatus Fimivivens sp.]|nr:phage tail protein I [Candidatus Fimivivens sp.]